MAATSCSTTRALPVQALSDLLQLPGPVASFVQQQLAAPGAATLGATRPGHCMWQLRKLLPPAGAVTSLQGSLDSWSSGLDAYECVSHHLNFPPSNSACFGLPHDHLDLHPDLSRLCAKNCRDDQ